MRGHRILHRRVIRDQNPVVSLKPTVRLASHRLSHGEVCPARVYPGLASLHLPGLRAPSATQYVAMGREWENLGWAIEDINQYPLKLNAIARLNRERKAGVSDKINS